MVTVSTIRDALLAVALHAAYGDDMSSHKVSRCSMTYIGHIHTHLVEVLLGSHITQMNNCTVLGEHIGWSLLRIASFVM